jgi:hypothetical protein
MDIPVTTAVPLAQPLRDSTDMVQRLGKPSMQTAMGEGPAIEGTGKGLARELDITESFLEKLAEEVRKDLGAK